MDFQKLLENHLIDIICFVSGIIIGLLLVTLIYILLISINKKIVKKRKEKNKENIIYLDTTKEIDNAVNKFYLKNEKETFTNKIKNTKDICFELVENIANKYHPNSSNPLGEISIIDLVNIIQKIEKDIVEFIYAVLDHKLFKITYNVARTGYNIFHFFKKEEDRIEQKNPKYLPISDIIRFIEKVMSIEKKETSKDITNISIINKFINNKIEFIIRRIGYYASNTFSKGIE